MQTNDPDSFADPTRRTEEVRRERGGDGEPAYQDLETYQVELELQKEALRRAKAELGVLRETQQRSGEILESITDAFYAVDADWRLTYVNQKTAALWGHSQEDLVGQVLWSLFPKPEETRGYHEHLRAMAERIPVYFETLSPYLHFWAGVSIYPAADGGLAVYFRDITERKRVEELLREREGQLRLHVENTPLAVIEWGADFRLSGWSAGAERIFGWRAEEVLGKRLDEFRWVYNEDVGQVERVSGRLLNGTGLRSVSHNRNYRKDGSVIHCEWYNSSLLDESGNLGSILSLVLDVTKRKRAEAEREQLLADLATERESLELRVQERTEALLRVNEELRREFAEREMAEAALVRSEKLAAAGKLATALAHEIKNPLQAIIGCAQLAKEALPADEEVVTYLSMVIEEARRISALVGELRDLQQPVHQGDRQPVSMNAVVEKQLGLNKSRAREQGVVVEWQPGEDLPPVWGVAGRLQQVFLNLLLNAFDVMPGGGRLQVCSEADPEGKGVWFHITDSGPGIPDDILPHMFEPFYTTRAGGQGLGLFICHTIVAGHGGRIEVDSRAGEGTTFSVWLPAAE